MGKEQRVLRCYGVFSPEDIKFEPVLKAPSERIGNSTEIRRIRLRRNWSLNFIVEIVERSGTLSFVQQVYKRLKI
ncbi:MAG: hypothetical protein ACPK85_12820 [Methanosarcina sp.]